MTYLNRFYPRLSDEDIALLLDFITDNAAKYHNWQYDVRVGPGRDPGESFDPGIRKMAIQLSQRRIDALAETKDAIEIFELTQKAEYRPIGQLVLYAELYRNDFKPSKPVTCGVICREMSPDIRILCENLGYAVHLYPPEATV